MALQSATQSLLVDFSWIDGTSKVLDPSSQAVLYTIKHRPAKPQLVFTSADNSAEVGKSAFHFMTSKLDVQVGGQKLELKRNKRGSSGYDYSYKSPSFQNQNLTWTESGGLRRCEFECLDEGSQSIATFSCDAYLRDRTGKLEFVSSKIDDNVAKEEILLTALTLVYNKLNATVAAYTPERQATGAGSSVSNALSNPIGRMY